MAGIGLVQPPTELTDLLPWLLWTERLLAGLLIGGTIAVVAMLSPMPWRVFAALFVIPSGFLLVAVFGLPGTLFTGDATPGAPAAPKVNVSALVSVGLAPFIAWWLCAPGNSYLAAAAGAAGISAAWCLMEVNGSFQLFFRNFGCRRLAALARVSREWSFYGVLLPVLVINGLFVWGCLTMPNIALPDLPAIWQATPRWLLLIMLVPVLLMGLLAMEARRVVGRRVRAWNKSHRA